MGLPLLLIGGIVIASVCIPMFFIMLWIGLLNDFFVMGAMFLFSFFVPAILFFLEIGRRRMFPIRCTVSYELGGERGQKNTFSTEDRIGYVDIKGQDGKSTGAKEWRLCDMNKPVQNFSYAFVGDKAIWFGFRVDRHAHVVAVMGEKGEEFYPQAYDASVKGYKPVFDGDRGLRLFKIFQDIQNRNKYADWLKDNIMQLAKMGLDLAIVIMLFLCFMQLTDTSKMLGNALQANNACLAANQYFQNAAGFDQNNATVQPKPENKIAGIPFSFG